MAESSKGSLPPLTGDLQDTWDFVVATFEATKAFSLHVSTDPANPQPASSVYPFQHIDWHGYIKNVDDPIPPAGFRKLWPIDCHGLTLFDDAISVPSGMDVFLNYPDKNRLNCYAKVAHAFPDFVLITTGQFDIDVEATDGVLLLYGHTIHLTPNADDELYTFDSPVVVPVFVNLP